jgi:hypothetical protein
MEKFVFEREAAAEYDRAFAHVTRHFMPCYWLSKWAHIWPQTKVKRTCDTPPGVVADRG